MIKFFIVKNLVINSVHKKARYTEQEDQTFKCIYLLLHVAEDNKQKFEKKEKSTEETPKWFTDQIRKYSPRKYIYSSLKIS